MTFNWSESALAKLAADLNCPFTVKLSPAVEGLALTAWWREHYGTAEARRRTRAAALEGVFPRTRAADHGPVDINGDPVPTPQQAAELAALRMELAMVKSQLTNVRESYRQYRAAIANL
jgi:hypothetical protein